jgi:predicted RNase H-like HicB family nuclease
MQYAIVIEKAPGSNYSAYVPDLPGCIATADSLEDVKRLMKEGIAFHVEGMREDGLSILGPTTQVAYANVARFILSPVRSTQDKKPHQAGHFVLGL